MGLLQVVARDHGEQVMIDLVLESTAEPVDETLGNSVSTGNVTSGCYLELPEIGSGLGIVDSHAVVSQTEHNGKEESARTRHEHEQRERVQSRESSETGDKGKYPGVVNSEGDHFENGVLKSLGFALELGVFGSRTDSVGVLEGFIQPRKTSQQQDGEVEKLLVADHELCEWRILSIITKFSERLRLLEGPGQDRHGINVGISVLRSSAGVVEVGNGVVTIVLVLPPLHGESLHDATPKESGIIAVATLLVDLVVQKVVCQPSALLEKETHPKGSGHVNKRVLREIHHGQGGSPHGHVRGLLVNVKPKVALEHSHLDELLSEFTVRSLECVLVCVLVFHTLNNEITDEELLQQVFGTSGVESGKDVGGIVTGVGEDDGATGMVVPVGNVVDLVVVDDPGIVRSGVILHIRPGVLWHLFQLVLALEGDSSISSFTHDCFLSSLFP